MPIRRLVWARLVSAAAVALGTGGATLAQTGTPKYYPGTITPYPGQQQGAPAVRATTPTSTPTVPTAHDGIPQPKPRLFAPPEGVRQVSATSADLPKPLPVEPPTSHPGSDPIGPTVTSERVYAPPPSLPPTLTAEQPRLPDAAGAPPSASAHDLMTTIGSHVGPRQTPAVVVEYDMPESVGVGQPLSYSLVVRNTGATGVSGVQVEQQIPNGAAFVSSEPSPESNANGRLRWSVGNLEAASEKRIKVTVKPTDEGELRGRASVTFTTEVEGKVKVTRPRVNVTLTAPEVVRVGEKVAFTIKLTNTGSGPANTMTLHARLTDGLAHPAGHVIEAPLTNLPAGQSKTLTLETTATKPGAQQCVLSVFADSNPAETAKTNVTLVEPQLTAKQSGPTKCLVNAEPVYQIELANPGTATTDPLTVWTVLPEGFEFVQASDSGAFAATNRAVVWKLAGLPAGTNKTITLKLRSVAPTDGVIRTIAQSGTTDQSGGSGVAQVAAAGKGLEAKGETVVKAEGVPALRFEVIDLDDPVVVGSEAVYEVKVTNQGTGDCTNVTLVAELSDGTAFGGVSGPSNAKSVGNTIVFDALAQLPVKGEAVYKVRVKGGLAGDSRFRVKLSCDQISTPVSKEESTRFYKD